jgi:hypothetical protein
MPWGAVIGAAGSLIGGSMAAGAASDNAAASAQTAANELQATGGYGINSPFGSTYFNTQAHTAGGQQSGPYAGLESGLLGNSQFFSNQLSGLGASGGINPLLSNAYNQYAASLPSTGQVPNNMPSPFFTGQQNVLNLANGASGLASQYLGQASNSPQVTDNGFGAQLTGAGSGLLNQYSQYNPQQAAQQYASNLNAMQAPQQQVAAQGLAQQLFNSGNLGSTGGANQMQALQTSQGLQQTANNVAGQQYGFQNQMGMLQQAQNMGTAGTALQYQVPMLNQQLQNSAVQNYNTAFNQALGADQYGANATMNQSNTAFNRGMSLAGLQGQTAQSLFGGALGVQGAGLNNLNAYSSLSNGLLSGGQSIDQQFLNQLQLGSNMGAARTGAAVSAGNTSLAGQIASNNANAQMYSGLINGIGNANWGSLFNRSGPSGSGGTNYGGMASQYGYNYNDDGSGY